LIWPLLSIPAKVFSKDYFAFWVLLSIVWGFGAAVVITVLPLLESSEEIGAVLSGIMGKKDTPAEPKEEVEPKEAA